LVKEHLFWSIDFDKIHSEGPASMSEKFGSSSYKKLQVVV